MQAGAGTGASTGGEKKCRHRCRHRRRHRCRQRCRQVLVHLRVRAWCLLGGRAVEVPGWQVGNRLRHGGQRPRLATQLLVAAHPDVLCLDESLVGGQAEELLLDLQVELGVRGQPGDGGPPVAEALDYRAWGRWQLRWRRRRWRGGLPNPCALSGCPATHGWSVCVCWTRLRLSRTQIARGAGRCRIGRAELSTYIRTQPKQAETAR